MKRIIVAALLAVFLMSAASAYANTVNFGYGFDDFNEYWITGAGSAYKNDSEQKYYFTIDSGNVSGSQVFGAAPRIEATGAQATSYRTWTAYVSGASYGYYPARESDLQAGAYVRLRGKKDNSSTDASTLTVGGRFTP